MALADWRGSENLLIFTKSAKRKRVHTQNTTKIVKNCDVMHMSEQIKATSATKMHSILRRALSS